MIAEDWKSAGHLINQFHVGFFGFLDQKWLLPGIYCDSTSLEVEVASTKDFHTSPHKSTQVHSGGLNQRLPHIRGQGLSSSGHQGHRSTWQTWETSDWEVLKANYMSRIKYQKQCFRFEKKHAHHIHCHPCLVDLTPPCARSGDFLPIM